MSEEREDAVRSVGRPRDPGLDAGILRAAERQLLAKGYAGMSLESVARRAGTTVPSLRRRHATKAALAEAVIDSMRLEPLRQRRAAPRDRALSILQNFRINLERTDSFALLGTLLSEEERNPQLIQRFRERLVQPRRAELTEALMQGVSAGNLRPDVDVDAAVNMLIGSFYAKHLSARRIPTSWPQQVLAQVWPDAARPAEARKRRRNVNR